MLHFWAEMSNFTPKCSHFVAQVLYFNPKRLLFWEEGLHFTPKHFSFGLRSCMLPRNLLFSGGGVAFHPETLGFFG